MLFPDDATAMLLLLLVQTRFRRCFDARKGTRKHRPKTLVVHANVAMASFSGQPILTLCTGCRRARRTTQSRVRLYTSDFFSL